MKKKIIAIAMLAVIALSGSAVFAGCGNESPTDKSTASEKATNAITEPKTVNNENRIRVKNGKFDGTPQDIADIIDKNLKGFDYTVKKSDNYVDFRFPSELSEIDTSITVTEDRIIIIALADSHIYSRVLANFSQVLSNESESDAYFDFVLDVVRFDQYSMRSDGTAYKTFTFGDFKITGQLYLTYTPKMIAFSISPT